MKRTVFLTLLLILGTLGSVFTLRSPPFLYRAYGAQPEGGSLLQVTPAPDAPPTFQITLEELGYGEQILESPVGQEEYGFRLPENWAVEGGSHLDLEFSYSFTELEQEEGTELRSFGELSVLVDGSLLDVYALDATSLEHVRLRVDLPPDLFNERPGDRHEVNVVLNAWFLCDTAHIGKLMVHPESTLFLNYTLTPPLLDLADYPRPFSQWSFVPDQVRFILPAQPSEAEIHTAAIVAAGLGDLAGSNMVISATTDVDWLRMVEAGQAGPEHLFVIGQPGRNQLITWLSEDSDVGLPISVHPRELALSTQGPTAVVPGEVFTYAISVTNTTSARVEDFSLTDHLPRQTDLVDCLPRCIESAGIDGDEASWSLPSLSPGESASFSVELQLAETTHLSSPPPLLENLVVLADGAQEPVNVSSLSTTVGDEPVEERMGSPVQSGDFFTQGGRPVPEGDGILQEIISPWDPQQVILLLSGLSDEAVHKAGLALGLETGLLRMEGPAALVREVRPAPPVADTRATDLTLADLGYGDRIAYGLYPHVARIDYYFDVPRGWHYTNEAYLHLLFGYSEAIEAQSSTLTVLLNGSPLATVPLNHDNAVGGSLQVDLPGTNIRPGTRNGISIQPVMQIGNNVQCESLPGDQAWLRVSQDSWLHLGQRVESVNVLDLDDFPFPFDDRPDLSDVLFALPPDPGLVELEALVQMAATLGRAAGGEGVNPTVSLGDTVDAAMLRDYHIVAIGRPTRNPLIQEINASLPQPFVPGTDGVENRTGEVLLRLPPDIPLGYVQELPSPWNQDRAFLAVTGTRDEAITWAAYALNRRAWQLDGNLVLTRMGEEEIEVRSYDTRRLTSSGQAVTLLTAVPDLTPMATLTPTPGTGDDSGEATSTEVSPDDAPAKIGGLPVWAMVFIGIAGVTIVAMLAVGMWRFRQRRQG